MDKFLRKFGLVFVGLIVLLLILLGSSCVPMESDETFSTTELPSGILVQKYIEESGCSGDNFYIVIQNNDLLYKVHVPEYAYKSLTEGTVFDNPLVVGKENMEVKSKKVVKSESTSKKSVYSTGSEE